MFKKIAVLFLSVGIIFCLSACENPLSSLFSDDAETHTEEAEENENDLSKQILGRWNQPYGVYIVFLEDGTCTKSDSRTKASYSLDGNQITIYDRGETATATVEISNDVLIFTSESGYVTTWYR